jgi:hypothetical protein
MHLLSQNLQQAPWGPCPCALSLHSVTSEPEGLIPTWYRLITSLLRLSVHKIYKAHPFCRLVCPSLPNWSHHAFLLFSLFFFSLVAGHLIEIPSNPDHRFRTRALTRPTQLAPRSVKLASGEPLHSLFLSSLILGSAPTTVSDFFPLTLPPFNLSTWL